MHRVLADRGAGNLRSQKVGIDAFGPKLPTDQQGQSVHLSSSRTFIPPSPGQICVPKN